MKSVRQHRFVRYIYINKPLLSYCCSQGTQTTSDVLRQVCGALSRFLDTSPLKFIQLYLQLKLTICSWQHVIRQCKQNSEAIKQLLQEFESILHSTAKETGLTYYQERSFHLLLLVLSDLFTIKNGWHFFNSPYKRGLLCFIETSPRAQMFYPIIYYSYIY